MKSNERSQTVLLLVGLVVVAVVLSLAVLGGSSASDGPGSDRQAAGGTYVNEVCVYSSGKRVTAEFTDQFGRTVKSFQTIGTAEFPDRVCGKARFSGEGVAARIDYATGVVGIVLLEGTATRSAEYGVIRVESDPSGRCTGSTARQQINVGQAAVEATCGPMTYTIQMVRNPYDERQLRVDVS